MNIDTMLQQYAEFQRLEEDARAEKERVKAEILAYMKTAGVESLTGSEHKCSYKPITQTRLDSTALKQALPDVAARFTISAQYMRFTFK